VILLSKSPDISERILMQQDFQTIAKVEQWRKKALAGELSIDECKEIVIHLRGNRVAAATTQKPSKSHQPKAQPIDGDDLLKDFGL
jgi:hypothetical protein